MEFNLDARTAQLSVGELADFRLGPRESAGGPQGLWRAQLGTHWHQQLRAQATEQPGIAFEVSLTGRMVHRGWTLTFTGRIDQMLVSERHATLREIKTVTEPLPREEDALRADYSGYFAQIGAYVALARSEPASLGLSATHGVRAELIFVEVGSGLSQTVALQHTDQRFFEAQLERVTAFLDSRWRARERHRKLQYRPAFAALRPGQEDIQTKLEAAFAQSRIVFFEAPTGYGKTGVLLEFALAQLRRGTCERILYLTSKATGQLHVVDTLSRMLQPAGAAFAESAPGGRAPPSAETARAVDAESTLASWVVRPKREHCINSVFHCVREACPYLEDLEARWTASGLAELYVFPHAPRGLPQLREAGRVAGLCPYEITRAALPYNDVWIGDYNYVFSPANRVLFYDQPAFDPQRTLLVIDEAHNLPSRVADVYSYRFTLADAARVSAALESAEVDRRLARAWLGWCDFLQSCPKSPRLEEAAVDDALDLLKSAGDLIAATPFDAATMPAEIAELLWQIPNVVEDLSASALPRLWWSREEGELLITCLDAANAIGETLRSYGGVVLASATLTPSSAFATACGLEQGAELAATHSFVRGDAPWRAPTYDVGLDLRVDTTYQRRSQHAHTTARTIETLRAASSSPVVVFFPSYAYAESIEAALRRADSVLRVALQPRLPDLAAQSAWVEESLVLADALFLVLGSSFSEGIDLLGGRISHAMVVGPALPEMNSVQEAKLAAFSSLGRNAAFRRVYQIPGIQKVNQALGRLVRSPEHRAKVLLHCRRFGETSYAQLLAPEYQLGQHILEDVDLKQWLQR